MSSARLDDLLATARIVLADNRRGEVTVPHHDLFPAAYLWDTAVTAKGIAVFDPARAAGELLAYLRSQWRSGMLPNEAYLQPAGLRERLFGDHPDRPDGLVTSGITQPMMIGRAVLEVGRRLGREDRRSLFTAAAPALASACRWAFERRIGPGGLAVVIHPYETGMDNRLDLVEAMSREWLSDPGRWARLGVAAGTTLARVVRRLAGDARRIPTEQRSSDAELLAGHLQTRHVHRHGYDLAALLADGRGVLIEDPGFNAVLLDAAACLVDLVHDLPDGLRGEVGEWAQGVLPAATESLAKALEELWFEGSNGVRPGYYARDARTGQLLLRPTVAGLFPLLLDGIPPDRAAALLAALTDPEQYGTPVAPPSAPVDSEGFLPERYWRGAAWSFPLDVLETALVGRGEHEIASRWRRAYLERPWGAEHAEYENPLTGRPLGVLSFSPAAALSIRLAEAEGVLPK